MNAKEARPELSPLHQTNQWWTYGPHTCALQPIHSQNVTPSPKGHVPPLWCTDPESLVCCGVVPRLRRPPC